jgi:hypothetical protein
VGFALLIIIGVKDTNWLYIIGGGLVFMLLFLETFKLITWKVTFYDAYIYVPSSTFDKYIFGKNIEQKVNYIDIEKIELQVRPVQVLVIKCKGKKNPNIIYVKQFSRKQVEKLIQEIDLRIKNT